MPAPHGSRVEVQLSGQSFADHFNKIGGSCVGHMCVLDSQLRSVAPLPSYIGEFVEADQSNRASLIPRKDISVFRNCGLLPDPNHFHIPAIPFHTKGQLAIVTNAERGAVDADAPMEDRRGGVRRSRMVLTPRRWRQVRVKERGRR
jgi:hypothetical protein